MKQSFNQAFEIALLWSTVIFAIIFIVLMVDVETFFNILIIGMILIPLFWYYFSLEKYQKWYLQIPLDKAEGNCTPAPATGKGNTTTAPQSEKVKSAPHIKPKYQVKRVGGVKVRTRAANAAEVGAGAATEARAGITAQTRGRSRNISLPAAPGTQNSQSSE